MTMLKYFLTYFTPCSERVITWKVLSIFSPNHICRSSLLISSSSVIRINTFFCTKYWMIPYSSLEVLVFVSTWFMGTLVALGLKHYHHKGRGRLVLRAHWFNYGLEAPPPHPPYIHFEFSCQPPYTFLNVIALNESNIHDEYTSDKRTSHFEFWWVCFWHHTYQVSLMGGLKTFPYKSQEWWSTGLVCCILGFMPNVHRKLVRSVSVTPPIPVPSNVSEWLNSQDDLALHNMQNENNNVVEGHPPLSPQSSVTSSGSGSDNQDSDLHSRNTFLEDYSGMKGKFYL